MKAINKKKMAICLCAALALGGVGGTSYTLAAGSGDKKNQSKAATVQTDDDNRLSLLLNEEEADVSKNETVYVLAGADGTVQKIIVSDWIRNTIGEAALTDTSELSDIELVKGNEKFTVGSDNTRVWDAQGDDIYYQGNIEKELPVGMTVTYKLDGSPVSPAELAGKSGRVSIRFDYTNNQYEYVEIAGQKEKIYVPFAVLTGILLDNDTFTNVEVSNGKLVNDGTRTAIIGIAFPGLQEDLGVDAEDFTVPDYVEITADVKNFELGITITMTTNEIFNRLDTENMDSVDDLRDSLDELTDGMNQLLDGSSQLYDGLCTLLDKSGELVDGIDKLAAGARTLKKGTGELDAGIGTLQGGAAELSAGLHELTSNNSELNGGAEQVFNTLLATAGSQLAAAGLTVPEMTIANYANVLNGVILSLDQSNVYNQALQQVTAAVEAQRANIETQVTAVVKQEVTTQVTAAVRQEVTAQVTAAMQSNVEDQAYLTATGMDKATYLATVSDGDAAAAVQAAVNNVVAQQMASETVQNMITAATDTQMESAAVQATVTSYVNGKMASDEIRAAIVTNTEKQVQKAIADNMASEAVQSKLAAADEGAKSVIALKASLDSYNSFYLGLQAYTSGVASVAAGADKLKNGVDTLKTGSGKINAGMTELCDGILKLQDGAPALVDGVTRLRDGSMELSDGLQEFNEKGIQELVRLVDEDLDGVIERLKATAEVSRNYRSFAGISDEMDGNVKFIYRTDSIEAR